MGVWVICSYQPNEGKADEVAALVEKHAPTLRAQGLLGDERHVVMTGEDGSVVEIFQWASEEAARSAESNPAVQEIWKAMADAAAFVPMASLKECESPFAHFAPLG